MNEIQRRVAATQKTQARFEGREFDWSKRATCVHLMRYHASNMGHKLPMVPRFRTALGAMKALKAEGVETLPELMDKYFPRIPSAQMLTGDMAAFPGDSGFHALMVYGQLHAFIGKHEDAPDFQFMRVSDEGYRQCEGAWRL
ncbi:MAG: hypothetical protein AAGB23_05200 [Pseudomonadota bacterium]